jgi:hypothetical protein
MTDLDPVEDGQAECRFCGEWYHVGLLALGHTCAAKRKHDEVVRFTRPEALRGGKRVEPVFYDDEEPEF